MKAVLVANGQKFELEFDDSGELRVDFEDLMQDLEDGWYGCTKFQRVSTKAITPEVDDSESWKYEIVVALIVIGYALCSIGESLEEIAKQGRKEESIQFEVDKLYQDLEEEEPPIEEYDPGPEVDDEGGMSEYRYGIESEEPEDRYVPDPGWPPQSSEDM